MRARAVAFATLITLLVPLPPAQPQRRPAGVSRPQISKDPIPYDTKRKHQMARYSRRHYGRAVWRLRHPRVVVLHFTGGSSYQSAWNTFAANSPNRGELPGVCAQFVIGQSGTIHQLVDLNVRCRHAIGLNYTSVGIEMVQETGRGSHWADRQILRRKPQIRSALKLVRFLRSKFGIRMRNVIGHSMANNSPFFEDHEGWTNTHTDWLWRDVREFRRRLRKLG